MGRLSLCAFCGLFLAEIAAGQSASQRVEPKFLGAQSCSSSSCHGGAGEKRSQYFTWLRKDFHTRAFPILTNARSERIAEALKIENPTSNNRCTSCHSPAQTIAPTRLATRVDPQAGVSCESCHGAASTWLRGHTRPDWTYAHRVGAGMRDLKSFYVRANTCVACHQNIDGELTAAGHPDLVFELNRQSIAQPKHWTDPPGSETKAWLVGQAVALREASWKLAQNPAASEQTFAQWQGLAWLLSKVTAAAPSLPPIRTSAEASDRAEFARVQREADALARRAAGQNFGDLLARQIANELATSASEFQRSVGTPREHHYRRAQRLVLALAALDRDRDDGPRVTEELREDIRSLAEFDPAQFARHLAELGQR